MIIIELFDLNSGDSQGYLQKFDVEAHDSRLRPYPTGCVTFTKAPEMAMKFISVPAALEYYRQTSKLKPTRPDGKPNRPLTAYTALFLEMLKAPTLQ